MRSLFLFAVMVVVSCAPPPVAVGCEDESDCAGALRCLEGVCQPPDAPDAGPPPEDAGPPVEDAGPGLDGGGVDAGTCVDDDGDGRGVGCALGPDCDDTDEAIFASLIGFEDRDADGVDAERVYCTDGELPTTATPTTQSPQLDCNDAHPGVYPSAVEVCDGFDNDCDGDVDLAPVCPYGALNFDGSTGFVRMDEGLNWFEARVACEERDMLLAMPRGAARTAALAPRTNNGVWIGLSDRAVPDSFEWEDGLPLLPEEEAWGPGQPNNLGGNQECVTISAGTDLWGDELCSDRDYFACQPALGPPQSCVDNDGDGRGPRCAAGPDCDDGDPDVWGRRDVYVDRDSDGFVAVLPETECVGDGDGPSPEGRPLQTQLDCDDGDNAIGNCDDGCFRFDVGGRVYLSCTRQQLAFDDAQADCADRGGHLAVLETRERAVLVKRALYRLDESYDGQRNYWIGLSNPLNDNLTWLWVDNTPYLEAEADWDVNEPDSLTQSCVDLRLDTEAWRDNECTDTRRYICER